MDNPANSPYASNWGPLDGPLLDSSGVPCLGVIPVDAALPLPIGIAYPFARDAAGRAVFRLEVNKAKLPGRWVLIGRRFVRTDG